MSYQLSQAEKNQIQTYKNAGNYAEAYRYISGLINSSVQSGQVAASTQRWFNWAAEINGNEKTFINAYARTFTKMGASADGITITSQGFQDSSNGIAETVLGNLITSGIVPTTPESIILSDIQVGSSTLGIDNEDFAGTLIGAFLFDTPTLQQLIINDPTNIGIWSKIEAICYGAQTTIRNIAPCVWRRRVRRSLIFKF